MHVWPSCVELQQYQELSALPLRHLKTGNSTIAGKLIITIFYVAAHAGLCSNRQISIKRSMTLF